MSVGAGGAAGGAKSHVLKRELAERATIRPVEMFGAPAPQDLQSSEPPPGGSDAAPPEGAQAPEHAEIERLVRQCRALAAALARERETLLQALEPRLVNLAFEIARRILGHEATVDSALVESTVAAAIAAAPQAASIIVRVSPADVDAVARVFEADGKIRVVADETTSPGGCTLETDWGDIDATLETQLGKLQAALQSARLEDL
jgi:flagellar biosynthesis/type III secretory pathway protein FliH